MKCIHLWVSGIEEAGGIQHYSRCCDQALRELFPDARLRVFSKNDMRDDSASGFHAFGRKSGMARTLAFASSGLRWALKERPDFVLSTHPHFAKAMMPLKWLGIPCLTAAHGIEVWGHLSGHFGRVLRSVDGILPVSAFTRDVIHREGQVPMNRMPVVPDTFREESFSPGPKAAYLLERHGLKPDQPVLFTVGRLSATERYKGQDQMLQALPKLVKELPSLRYIIGGRGDDEPRLRQMVAELALEKHVTFTGFIPGEELADHYRLADLYVMPSTGEGFGIVYLESLACGRPCVVGDQDASPEAIDHGRLGFVVPPRDPDKIAQAILKFFRREHEQPWLHEPETLHREVVKLYGHEAFKAHLRRALTELLPN
ncbi:MAG: glycosyltransferase family 4 protein [Verrucomicrobiota bacterium]